MAGTFCGNIKQYMKDRLEETQDYRKEVNASISYLFKVYMCIVAVLIILILAFIYISARHDAYIAKTTRRSGVEQQSSIVKKNETEEENKENKTQSNSDDNFAEEYLEELVQGKAFRIAMKFCRKECGSQYYNQGECYNKLQQVFALYAIATFFTYDVDVLDSELVAQWKEDSRNYRMLSDFSKQTFRNMVFGCD